MKICPYSFAQVLTLQRTYDNKNMVCIYMGFESDSNLFLMILRIKTTPLPLLNLVTNCKDFASLARPSTSRVMLLGKNSQPLTWNRLWERIPAGVDVRQE